MNLNNQEFKMHYINEPYQDEYQTPEAIAIEDAIDNEESYIKSEPACAFSAVLRYLRSEEFSDNEEQIENLGTLIEHAINADFINRHRYDVSLINAAIRWQATKNIEE
jgi:hypothetical protein